MKEYKRNIQKSVRELDRERNSLERQEKKLMADIKKEAKAGRNDTAKIMAKDLIRTRGYIKKMYKMKSHLEAISLRLTTMQTTNQMATSMKQVSKVMGKMNKQMNLPKIQEIMMNFEQENEKMAVKEEMMDDAMDDAFADDEDEDEEEKVLGAVFAELGIEQMNSMPDVGSGPATSASAAAADTGVAATDGGGGGGGDDDMDAELQKRLDNLKRT